jgi:hypothetical protein
MKSKILEACILTVLVMAFGIMHDRTFGKP